MTTTCAHRCGFTRLPARAPRSSTVERASAKGPVGVAVGAGAVGVAGRGRGRVTVKVRIAGEESVLPAASVARLEGVLAVAQRRVVSGEQAAHAPPSTRHSKRGPGSSELKEKVGVESLVAPEGPELIVVSGESVSASVSSVMTLGRSTPPLLVRRIVAEVEPGGSRQVSPLLSTPPDHARCFLPLRHGSATLERPLPARTGSWEWDLTTE